MRAMANKGKIHANQVIFAEAWAMDGYCLLGLIGLGLCLLVLVAWQG
jgi:hypothetical protein